MSFKLGILGYGQLGRMLAITGFPLNVDCVFYDIAMEHLYRALPGTPHAEPIGTGKTAVVYLQNHVDCVTYETENTSVDIIHEIFGDKTPVFPSTQALLVTQNRILEKQTCEKLGIATTPFAPVHSEEEAISAAKRLGYPLILKTVTQGYDGKGQKMVRNEVEAKIAWQSLNQSTLIAEKKVTFDHECSLICAQNHRGEQVFYPLIRNTHQDGILHYSEVDPHHPLQQQAEEIAKVFLKAFGYVGVLTIEFFASNQSLILNELAPRVHNSGHWTIEGAQTSQFEQHLRAIMGLPLGSTTLKDSHIQMFNMIGQEWPMASVLAVTGAHFHSYGKEPRAGRKLGHVTVLGRADISILSQHRQ